MAAVSLRAKITLALLFVGLSSAVLVGIVAREILLRRFDQIQIDESFGRFQGDVVQYFEKYQTWDNGVQSEPFGQFSRELNAQRGRGGRGRAGGPSQGGPPPGAAPREEEQPPRRFPLFEPDTGKVLLGTDEFKSGLVPAPMRSTALPIRANGRVVANAIPLRQPNFNAFD